MRLVVVAVGKVKERGVREAIDDYARRLARYVPFEEIELREGPGRDVVETMLRRLPDGAHVVALEVEGAAYTSEGFAKLVERRGRERKGVVAFLIGGADGLPREVVARAHEKLSLSTMTLPHRLARLVLAEQLYRAMTILRGEPYPR